MCDLAVRGTSELSDSRPTRRCVRSDQSKYWQPPEGLASEDVPAVIEAAPSERDRLLLRVISATGARISEALTLRPMDVRRDSLVLPNLENPSRPTKRVLALRSSTYGRAGEPAPVHPHLFPHARVRQIMRTTNSVTIAQKQAGWSRLPVAYLTVGGEEVRAAMQRVGQ